MGNDEMILMFDYLYWVRDRVLAAASALSAAQFTSNETVATRDLRGTLVHELDVEWSWRKRLHEGRFPEDEDLKAEDYATVGALAEHWRSDEAEMREWLQGLTEQDLASAPGGEESPIPLWYYGMHIVTHGMQQFAEAAVLLTRAGQSPGELGYLNFADIRSG